MTGTIIHDLATLNQELDQALMQLEQIRIDTGTVRGLRVRLVMSDVTAGHIAVEAVQAAQSAQRLVNDLENYCLTLQTYTRGIRAQITKLEGAKQ